MSSRLRPRSRLTKTAMLLPSGEKARSLPLRRRSPGTGQRCWYCDVHPLVRLRSGLRARESKRMTSRSAAGVPNAGHQVARRRDRRREVLRSAALFAKEAAAEVARLTRRHQLRQVLVAQPLAKVGVEVVGLDAERAFQRAVDVAAQGTSVLVQEVEHSLGSPSRLHEVETACPKRYWK